MGTTIFDGDHDSGSRAVDKARTAGRSRPSPAAGQPLPQRADVARKQERDKLAAVHAAVATVQAVGTVERWLVLRALFSEGGQPLPDLAGLSGLSAVGIGSDLCGLEAAGLVERSGDPGETVWRLTPRGRQAWMALRGLL